MATLLGTWELGYGYGHIAHLAPLASALNVRGHRVAVASRNPATAEAAPGRPFADIRVSPIYQPPRRPPQPTLTYAQVIADGGFADPPAARVMIRAWLTLFDELKPEAILAEHAPMSILAAHVARLPVAMIGSGFMVPPATRPFPSLLPGANASEADRQAADAAADALVRDLCRAFGAPLLDGLAALLQLTLPCLTTWPELDIHGPRAGATYYGPIGGFAGAALPDWPKGAGPRLFVYLPPDRPAAPLLAQVVGALGWPTIWHGSRTPEFPLQRNIRFMTDPADLPTLLPHASLLVTRASHGTACQAIAAGRPQIMLPDTLETMLVARRLVAQRLGVAAGPDVDAIHTALETAAGDPAIAAATAAVRDRYARYRPELAAAQLADAIIGEFAL